MRTTSVLFWLGWVFALLLTALLLVWHWPLYPFSDPGIRLNEAAILFLLVMAVRWVVIAGLFVAAGVLVAARLRAATWAWAALPVALVLAHGVIGLVNLGVWNTWVSAGADHSPGRDKFLAAAYFAIPAAVLLALAVVKLTVSTRGAGRDEFEADEAPLGAPQARHP